MSSNTLRWAYTFYLGCSIEQQAYGYLWWVIDDTEGCYAAIGDSGNVIYVSNEKQLVVAITSIFMPRAKDRIELIKEQIECLFE